MAGSPAERQMRDDVAAFLRAELRGFRIVHELVVGNCRADIAAIGRDRLLLVELKSERDVIKRAEKQMQTFVASSHSAILVADTKYFDHSPYGNGSPRCASTDDLDRCGGELWHYPRPPAGASLGEGSLYQWRLPRATLAQPCALYFLGLLWRDELVSEARLHGVDATRRMNINEIAAGMSWHMTGREIAEAVCRQLRLRSFPEADAPVHSEAA